MNDAITTEDYKGYTIETHFDSSPLDPREYWDNYSTMLCWHRNYGLGDVKDNNYDGPEEFVKRYLEEHPIALHFAAMKLRAGQYKNLRLTQDKDVDGDDIWYVEEYEKLFRDEEAQWYKKSASVYSYDLEDIGRELLDILNFGQLMELLNPYLEWRTISMYDHSGISLWLGSKWSHFDAQWDCSEVGICYCEKETILKAWPDVSDWREKANEVMSDEMDIYGKYVQGMVYGFTTCNPDGDDVGSCWGFYDEKEAIEEAKACIDADIKYEAKKAEERFNALKESLHKLVGKTFVRYNDAYQVTTDMFGFPIVQSAKIVKHVMPTAFGNTENVRDLSKDVQTIMLEAI